MAVIQGEIIFGKPNIQQKRKEAWNYVLGNNPTFSIDNMCGAEYKYFDMLIRTYTALYNKEITKEEAKALDDKAYAEFENASEDAFNLLQAMLHIKKQVTQGNKLVEEIQAHDKDSFIVNICNLFEDIIGMENYTKRVCEKLGIEYSEKGGIKLEI